MAEDNELVYRIDVQMYEAMRNVEQFKGKLREATKEMQEFQNAGKGQGKDSTLDGLKDSVTSLPSKLREVRKAIDLITQGYQVMDSKGKKVFSQGELRAYEKALEDLITKMKGASLNNIVSEMDKMQSQALKENAAVDKLIKTYENLARAKRDALAAEKEMSSSTWYNRQNRERETIDALAGYGIRRESNYNQTHGQHRAEIAQLQAQGQEMRLMFDRFYAEQDRHISENSARHKQAWNEIVSAERNYETAVLRANQALEHGVLLTEQQYTALQRTVTEARAAALSMNGNMNVTDPFNGRSYQQYRENTLASHAQEWSTAGIKGYSQELQRLVAVQEQMYMQWKSNPTDANRRALIECTGTVKKLREEYGALARQIDITSGREATFMGKLRSHLYWIGAGSLLAGAFAIPYETFNTINELDEGMHNLMTVMPQIRDNEQALNAEQTKLIETAGLYGASVKDMVESARLWGRMYKDQQTVNVLTSQSAKLAVADNFSMAESTKAVEAAMFQFGLQAKNASEAMAYSNKIVDVYTKLSHNAGVSAQDLAMGVERSGSVAHQAGISFEFLNALIAQGTRATALSGAEIGNMLKTMLASFNSKKAVQELDKLGIKTREVDADGKEHMRSAQAVLMDVAVAAQGTNKDLKNLWIQLSGGKFQWAKAAAMFSDYKEIIKNWGLAVNSMGFTDQQVKEQMDSLTRRIQRLKADMTQVIMNGGNGGLTATLKDAVTTLDRILIAMSKISPEALQAAGAVGKMAIEFLLIRKLLMLIGTEMAKLAFGASFAGMAASVGKVTTAVMGLKNAFIALKAAIRGAMASSGIGLLVVGISLAVDQLSESWMNEANAENDARQAAQDHFSAKQQEIDMLDKQAEFVDALMTAHQKLDAQIADSTTTDEKKIQLEKDRGETEIQLAKIIGQSAVDQLKADGWTMDSIKKVKGEYLESNNAKKKALAEFLAAKQQEAIQNYTLAQQNIQNWHTEAEEYCTDMSKKIEAVGLWAKAVVAAYEIAASFRDFQAKGAQSEADRWQKSADDLLAQHPDGSMSEDEVKQYRHFTRMAATKRSEADGYKKDAYDDRFNAFAAAKGDEIEKYKQQAQAATPMLNMNGLTDPGEAKDPNEFLKSWGGDTVGGDEANDSPSNKKEKKGKEDSHKKQVWQYGDDASKAIGTLSDDMDGSWNESGISVARLMAIVGRLTGINNLDFSGISDIFRNGSSDAWDSAFVFREQLTNKLQETDGDLEEALKKLYPDIGDWDKILGNDTQALDNNIDFKKQYRAFHDPHDIGYVGGDYDTSSFSNPFLAERAIKAAEKLKADGTDISERALYSLLMSETPDIKSWDDYTNNYKDSQWLGGITVEANSLDEWDRIFYNTVKNSPEWNGVNSPQAVKNAANNGTWNNGGNNDFNLINQAWNEQGWNRPATSDYASLEGKTWNKETDSVNVEGLDAKGKQALAIVSQIITDVTGEVATLSSADRNWGGHVTHEKLDFVDSSSSTTLEKNADMRNEIIKRAAQYGIAIVDEYAHPSSAANAGHLDVDASGKNWYTGENLGGVHGGVAQTRSRWNRKGSENKLSGFNRDIIKEHEYDFKLAQEDYEQQKKLIELQEKVSGSTYATMLSSYDNQEKYFEVVSKNKDFWVKAFSAYRNAVEDKVKKSRGIQDALQGKDIFDLPEDEMKKLAEVAKDPVLKRLVESAISARKNMKEIVDEFDDLKVQTMRANGYMTPDEGDEYRIAKLDEMHRQKTLGKSENETYFEDKEYLAQKREIYEKQYQRKVADYMKARTEGNAKREGALADLENSQNELLSLQQRKKAGEDINKQITEQIAKIKELSMNYNMLTENGTEYEQKAREGMEKSKQKLDEIGEEQNKTWLQVRDAFENGIGNMFESVLLEGGSFKESWKSLWKQIGQIAIQQLLKISVYKWLGNIFGGLADGGTIGKKATGGSIAGYANGNYIKGAGNGTSDSILAYVGNKDTFVYLSNGEYVMTAEATKRIGKENLDKMNYGHYATGGALSPTPYVPQLKPSITKKAEGINDSNPNANLERLTKEQTEAIRNMNNKDNGNGSVIVLNTHASSDDVMKALQENPRMLKTIMGQQRHMGFR